MARSPFQRHGGRTSSFLTDSWSFTRWTTGAKLFLILSAALLPLALIAMFATLQTTRIAEAETRARLRVAAAEGSRGLAIDLVGGMAALRAAANALAADSGDTPSCARVRGVFAHQIALGTRFTIVDGAGRILCGTPVPAALLPAANVAPPDPTTPITAAIVADRGVMLEVAAYRGGVVARVFFPRGFLIGLARPSGPAEYGIALTLDGDRLPLEPIDALEPLDRVLTLRTDLDLDGLTLESSVRAVPITSPFVIAMLLPLLMWAAAAGIGWFVVDRLLIRPLRRLRTSVAAFTPGEIIDTGDPRTIPAQEIRDLGDTFRAISRTVALHEAGLAEGLVRQTKLTREVHHRVKNNLQVISSLINFHARGAPSPDATAAYTAIQRRVDALAVVHRNHFAEMEENRGLNLRSVVGELATNIRANLPEGQPSPGITIDIESFLVTQDVAVAVAFLVTETIELALGGDPAARIRIATKPADTPDRATLRVVSRALIETDALRALVKTRYGRVMEGLARQLRAPLHHDPLIGAYEITIAVLGQE